MKTCLECHHTNPDDFTSCGRCGTPLPLATGTLLQGRLRAYRIIQVLGHGGFGITYLAEEQPTGRRVVIKELKVEAALKPKARELFEREARTLAQLDPARGVPDILDFFAEGARAYLVMEFIEGHNLAEAIARRGALPENKVVEIALNLLDILGYIHEQKVIHRDIKPANVMVRPDGSPVLIDFGAVKQAVAPEAPGAEKPSSSVVCTAGYAPPEQTRGLSVDQTADLFALGATLIHLLTGRHPVSLIDPQTGDYRWQHLVPASPRLAEVIGKATAYRPIDRYQSAREMAAALTGRPKVPGPEPSKVSVPPPVSRAAWPVHPALIWGAVTAILVVVGVILFSSYFSPEPTPFTLSVFESNAWRTYASDSAELAGKKAQAITLDAQGHPWVGTTGGIGVFDGHSWDVYTMSRSGLMDGDIRALAIDTRGRVWAGTPNGLMVFDGHSWGVYTTGNSGLVSNDIRALAIDTRGRVWAGTPRGVMVFDGHSWGAYTRGNSGLVSNDIRALAIDGQGRVWAGTPRGVMVFDGHSWGVYTRGNSGLISDDIRTLAVDDRGRVWAGTPRGLMIFDSHSWGAYTRGNSGLVSDDIRALAVDDRGRMWAGTPNGLMVFDGHSWGVYTTGNSDLASNDIRALAVDAHGRVWVGY